MRREFTLSSVNNTMSVTLPFNPQWVIVLNNTSNPVYIRRGNNAIPGTAIGSFDYKIPAAANGIPSNVQLPTSSYEFAAYLPTSPALTDTTQVVTIIFIGVPQEQRYVQQYIEQRVSASGKKK